MPFYKDSFKTDIVKTVYNDLINGKHYLFLGKTDVWGNVDSPDTIVDTFEEDNNALRDMFSAIQLKADDVYYAIRKNTWTSGVVYDEFSATENLLNKNYYVTVEPSSGLACNVYICISNNSGAVSQYSPPTTAPTNNNLIVTNDGYIWKFVYNTLRSGISTDLYTKVKTDSLIPFKDSGDNYLTTNVSFGSIEGIDITKFGEAFPYAVNLNENASYTIIDSDTEENLVLTLNSLDTTINRTSGFYDNRTYSLMVLDATTKIVLNVHTIDSLSISSNVIICRVCEQISKDNAYNNQIYKIVPKITISGNCSNLIAYPSLDTTTRKITKINIFQYGSGCSDITAEVIGNYELAPRISPTGGVGLSPLHDLKCNNIIIYKKFNPTSSDTYNKLDSLNGILSTPSYTYTADGPSVTMLGYDSNNFRQYGLIKREEYVGTSDNDFIINDIENLRNYDILTLYKGSSPTSPEPFYDVEDISNTNGLNGITEFTIDDYVAQINSSSELLAYGRVLSISFDKTSATTHNLPKIAVQTLYGTFSSSTTVNNLKKYNPTTGTTQDTLINTYAITSKNMLSLRGRVLHIQNFTPKQLTTDGSTTIKFFITI